MNCDSSPTFWVPIYCASLRSNCQSTWFSLFSGQYIIWVLTFEWSDKREIDASILLSHIHLKVLQYCSRSIIPFNILLCTKNYMSNEPKVHLKSKSIMDSTILILLLHFHFLTYPLSFLISNIFYNSYKYTCILFVN
jgi:hypothetical protein